MAWMMHWRVTTIMRIDPFRLSTLRPDFQVGWTQHGHSSIEVPRDCRIICRNGRRTLKGRDWEDTPSQPVNRGNKVIRLLPNRDAYHMTVITCYRTENLQRTLLEIFLCVAFGLMGTWLLMWLGYNMTGFLQGK